MLMWYAYRIQVLTNGPGQTRIAPTCRGNGPHRTCLFDEFLKNVQREGDKIKPWTGHTSVGTNLNPDVLDTADELAQPGGFNNNIDMQKVLPGAFDHVEKPTLEMALNGIVDSNQGCRRQAGDGELSDELDHCRRAIVSIHEARRADMGAGMIKVVNNMLKENGFNWVGVSLCLEL